MVDPEKLKHLDEKRRKVLAEDRLAEVFLRGEDNAPLKKAIVIALFAHIVLIGMVFPSFESKVDTEERKIVYMLRPYTPPAKKKERTIQKLEKVKRVPLPDPTPEEPEPIREPEPEPEPEPLPPDAIALIGTPAPPPIGAVGPAIAGVNATVPVAINKIKPNYPDMARKAGIQGKVFLQAIIDAQGNVRDASVISCTVPDVGFEQAAVDAVLQWKYKPGEQNGQPVDVLLNVAVDFTLQ